MKKLWIQKKRKRQKRCYRKDRRKDCHHEAEAFEMDGKAGDVDESWQDEHLYRNTRNHLQKR